MNKDNIESPGSLSASRIMLFLASLVVVAFGMREASAIITPIIIAFIVAILFSPLHGWLIDRRVPSWLALIIVMLIILLVISAMVSITVVSITQFINRIPEYSDSLEGLINNVLNFIETLPVDTSTLLSLESFDFSQILNASGSVLGGVADTFSNWFILILLVAMMLTDFTYLPQKFQLMFKDNKQIQAFSELILSIRRYLSITTWTGMLIGILNWILLMFLGVDFAVLWGVLGFLMNFIPSVGIIISFIPPTILALLEFGWQRALVSALGVIVINFVIENVVKPRVMEEDLNISPLFVVISLTLWTYILGPIGTILAVPLTLVATKLLLEMSDETQWLAILITANPRPKKEKRKEAK